MFNVNGQPLRGKFNVPHFIHKPKHRRHLIIMINRSISICIFIKCHISDWSDSEALRYDLIAILGSLEIVGFKSSFGKGNVRQKYARKW